MSTKNLSRTVIEGGRHKGNKYDRRKSHKYNRGDEKRYLHAVRLDPEHFDEVIEPEAPHVYKEFSDNLGPMYRWIDAQVGRPWDEVRSEIFEKFDTRTTAGRHITFDHLLASIVETNSGWSSHGYNLWDPDSLYRKSFWRHPHYYVNEEGILCRTEPRKKYTPYPSEAEQEALAEWLNGRMIGSVDGKLYWFTPQEGVWKTMFLDAEDNHKYAYSRRRHLRYCIWEFGEIQNSYWSELFKYWVTTKKHGWGWVVVDEPFSFRQRGPLTKEEIEDFNSLPEVFKKEILEFTKGR